LKAIRGGFEIAEITSTDLVTVDPKQDLDEALRLTAQQERVRPPLVEEDGRPAGEPVEEISK
jgi:CBS domain-containing protein